MRGGWAREGGGREERVEWVSGGEEDHAGVVEEAGCYRCAFEEPKIVSFSSSLIYLRRRTYHISGNSEFLAPGPMLCPGHSTPNGLIVLGQACSHLSHQSLKFSHSLTLLLVRCLSISGSFSLNLGIVDLKLHIFAVRHSILCTHNSSFPFPGSW